jgi:RNA polymerase sigma-70 factor (ECF subfamily)
MDDNRIGELYWDRDETAIRETDARYGRYLWTIAYNVLADREDSDECVNDSYYKAWSAMPPHRPASLSSFLGRIVRQLAVDRFRRRTAQKRAPSEYVLSLDELAECVSGVEEPHQTAELRALAQAVSDYLWELSREMRNVFLWRYYFMDSVQEIAHRLDASESQVKSMLHRTRLGLRAHLEKEGFSL